MSSKVPFSRLFRGTKVAALTFVIGFIMSIFAVGAVIQAKDQITAAFNDLRKYRDFETDVTRLLSLVVDSETGYRGFVISKDERSLEPFFESLASLDKEFNNIEQLLRSDQAFSSLGARYTAAARDALIGISVAVEAQRRNLENSAESVEHMFDIKAKVDKVRALNAEFLQIIQNEIVQKRVSLNQTITTLLTTIIVLLAGILLVSFTQARELVARARTLIQSQAQREAELVTLSENLDSSRAELHVLHQRLALALPTAKVKVFSIDCDGIIHWISETKIGLVQGKELPVSLASLTIEPDRPGIDLHIKEIFATGETRDFEMRVDRQEEAPLWMKITIAPAADASEMSIGTAVDITDLKRREESNFLLMRELSHRSKNLLAIVQAMARQTGRTSTSIDQFEQRLSGRLRSLAAGHDLMVGVAYSGAELAALIRSQIGPLTRHIGERIVLEGPSIKLRPEAAQNIGMAIHELASNAQLHGALSNVDGKVAINWSLEGGIRDGRLLVEWVETDGPPVAPPTRKGFGTLLIERNLPRALMGEVTLTYHPEGTRCHMSLPLARIMAHAYEPVASDVEAVEAE